MHSRTPSVFSAGPSRRTFVQTAAAIGGAATLASLAPRAFAAGSDTLKIGLVGCGGRGTGAAANALHGDSNANVVAMADLFPDRLKTSLLSLQKEMPDRVKVDEDHQFTGFDAYKKLIASVDVVLLATPPHFRPMHLKAAVEAGKHVFCEKPVAVDGPGLRSVMETAKLAAEKKTCLVSGLCYRYDEAKRETMARVHDGAVGEIINIQTNYNTGGLWSNPRKPEWSDMEWQLRNWLYFTWLSGDHIVEQHIHSLDKVMWTMKDEPPMKCTASGGRTVRTAPEFGNIYDHFNSVYEWKSGVKCFASCRQWVGADTDVSDHVFGTDGVAHIQDHRIAGKNPWHREPGPNMYDLEHIALFNAIRKGEPINNGDYMCKSTLMAIMARMSAYTGKTITWEQALNSKEDLSPAKYDLGELAAPAIAVPGKTKFF